MTHTALCNVLQFPSHWLSEVLGKKREVHALYCEWLSCLSWIHVFCEFCEQRWIVAGSIVNLQMTKEGIGPAQTVVTNSCELSCGSWKPNLSSVRTARAFICLNIPSIPTPINLFIRCITVTKLCSTSFIVWPYQSHTVIYSFT